jgi:isopenicillin-N N-acyltransferase like protein
MKKVIQLALIFSFLFFLHKNGTGQNQDVVTKPSSTQKVEMLADKQLRFLELSGTPYERGLMHGKLLKKEIQEVIRLFKIDIAETTKEDPDQFIAKFLEQTDYKTAVLKWMPELMDELRGISEGSGINIETIFMHQLGDEYWFNTQDILAHNCSSFGVNKSATHPSMAAQNMDIPPFYHGFQTVIKITEPDSDKEMMFLTIPGHLGITGMNNKAVSINCNTLMQLDYGKTGLPVTFVVRGVVNKSTQEEALQFLEDIKHASGQNYIIGGPDKVYSMECSANKVVAFRPFENSTFTYHTNHPMSNTDYNSNYLMMLQKNNKSTKEGLYQCQRIKSFEQRFTTDTEDIEIEDIKNVLRSRDNSGRDVVSNEHTYASVIYELSSNPKFIIAPGKPHEKEYIEIKF